MQIMYIYFSEFCHSKPGTTSGQHPFATELVSPSSRPSPINMNYMVTPDIDTLIFLLTMVLGSFLNKDSRNLEFAAMHI